MSTSDSLAVYSHHYRACGRTDTKDIPFPGRPCVPSGRSEPRTIQVVLQIGLPIVRVQARGRAAALRPSPRCRWSASSCSRGSGVRVSRPGPCFQGSACCKPEHSGTSVPNHDTTRSAPEPRSGMARSPTGGLRGIDGTRDIPRLGVGDGSECAKFWFQVLAELKTAVSPRFEAPLRRAQRVCPEALRRSASCTCCGPRSGMPRVRRNLDIRANSEERRQGESSARGGTDPAATAASLARLRVPDPGARPKVDRWRPAR